MSKSRTMERKKERAQEQKRQRQLMVVAGIIGLAVLAIIFLIMVNQPAEAPIPAESATRYVDIAQGTTDEGFHTLGSKEAPVKIIEYSDFGCTHCMEFHENVLPKVLDYIKAGQVYFTYVPLYGFGGVQNGEGAARAAICVGLQDKFWEFHDALFSWQQTYVNQAFTQNRIYTGLDNLGINRDTWGQCLSGNYPTDVLNAAFNAANLQNLTGTPTIVINGTVATALDLTTVTKMIDDALAAVANGVPAGATATPEITATPTVEPTAITLPTATATP